MNFSQECIYCHHKLYQLSDSMVKCSTCKKKYSPKKMEKIFCLIELFCLNTTALQASKTLNISYVSAAKYYENFRNLCAHISEKEYEAIRDKNCEYEEYFYLQQSKRNQKSAVFDAYNFITFDYEGHIYNILMPSLQKYKQQFIDDNLQTVYDSEFKRFKRNSRIIKLSKNLNKIVEFWHYFEELILIYKGISSDAFAFYLKEMEFKFNYDKETQQELLFQNYIELYYR